MLAVAAAIIIKNNKLLIAQREEGSNMEFKWEFPGGKLEQDETPEECLVREIKEELDMVIEPLDIFKVVRHKYKEKDILLLAYVCKLMEGEGKAIECNDFKWITVDELEEYEFTAADVAIVEKLRKDKRVFN